MTKETFSVPTFQVSMVIGYSFLNYNKLRESFHEKSSEYQMVVKIFNFNFKHTLIKNTNYIKI